ncbi:MAG: carbohydrate ABC transporter permease [Alphaproteobacteria bacterium]|nr:carbohydrate ABC transporter permease [Alphaproteobacteria bacterium]
MARQRSPALFSMARIGIIACHAVLMAGALVMVMPMLWMFVTAFKSAAEIAIWPPVFFPQAWTSANFSGAFETAPFGRFFLNSAIIALVSTASVMLTSLVAGSVFAKYRFPGRGLLFGLVLATAIVPFEAYMIPLYIQLVGIDWINTYQGIILPYLFMAFGIFLMRQHVSSSIPTELMEAGRVDGAGEWWILARVIAPLSGNALAAVGIFAFIQGWGIFIWPLLIANDQLLFNMELGLTAFQFAFSADIGKLMAGSVVSVVPMLIVFLLLRRRIIENMALTGIKG